jgi:transcriptional regulator with XRE-family HTH domain
MLLPHVQEPMSLTDARIRQVVGERIRKARTQAKLTQRDLAETLDIDKGQISRWERGHLAPSVMQLMHLSRRCNVRPETIVGGLVEPTWEQLTNGLDAKAQGILHDLAEAFRARRPAAEEGTSATSSSW